MEKCFIEHVRVECPYCGKKDTNCVAFDLMKEIGNWDKPSDTEKVTDLICGNCGLQFISKISIMLEVECSKLNFEKVSTILNGEEVSE